MHELLQSVGLHILCHRTLQTDTIFTNPNHCLVLEVDALGWIVILYLVLGTCDGTIFSPWERDSTRILCSLCSPTKMMRKIIIRKMHICKLAITCCEVWCQNANRQQHKGIPEPLQIFQPIFLGWTHSILKNKANRNRVHVENGTCATHAFRGVPFLHHKS